MDGQTVIAVVGGLVGGGGVVGIVTAVLTHRRESGASLLTALSARLTEVEDELRTLREHARTQDARYSRLWAYTRSLIDYAYRHRRDDAPGLPDMPEGLS